MLHLMKELEANDDRKPDEEKLLDALHRLFGCEPYLTPEDEREMAALCV
jgi:hypothetical protein